MFTLEFLHVIRELEYQTLLPHLRPGAQILEIGGGTGYQARRLTQDGFRVASIDVAGSVYEGNHEYPVQVYDGRTIPFSGSSFDIVFSSNVLEHVEDLAQLHAEAKRVLKPGGYCLHAMPTPAWRFWTIVTHYVDFVMRIGRLVPQLIPRRVSGTGMRDSLAALRQFAGVVKYRGLVARHGASGNTVSELVTFGRGHWIRHFIAQGFRVELAAPMGLFYTGNLLLGSRLPVSRRQALAKFLGSACCLYKIIQTEKM